MATKQPTKTKKVANKTTNVVAEKIAKQPAVRLQDWTVSELQADIARIRTDMHATRVAYFSGKERNTRKLFLLRKQLAKILTILSQKKV